MEQFTIIHRFYEAFQEKDYASMQRCYHPQAIFSDPAFLKLSAEEVRAMWEMLITASADLKIQFRDVKFEVNSGSCHWEAWYTFSSTGRKVHNKIDATFELKDGLIYRHQDHFNFWRWSSQALGLPGLLLGWTSFLKSKVRKKAKSRLEKFMNRPL